MSTLFCINFLHFLWSFPQQKKQGGSKQGVKNTTCFLDRITEMDMAIVVKNILKKLNKTIVLKMVLCYDENVERQNKN